MPSSLHSADAPTVTVAGADLSFSTAGYPTMLAAGLAAGVELPYECASGGCGMCKVRLVEGSVESMWPEATGLKERDHRAGNKILACQSVVTADCVIKAPIIPRSEPTRLVRTKAVVSSIVDLNHNTRRLVLRITDEMPYRAGQYVIVEFTDGVRRAYSMSAAYRSSGPGDDPELEVIVRAKPGGAATAWIFDRLSEGDGVVVEGPYGFAHLQSPADRPIVAIAGGSGLGPMLAIVEQALVDSPERAVHFYVGSRVPADRFCLDELAGFTATGVTVHHAVETDPDSDCRTGLVGDLVDADWDDLTDVDVYLCGPAGMVDAVLAQLVRTGKAAAERVFFDRFQ